MTLILTNKFGQAGAELKTFYSKQLLERLIPAFRHGYPIAILRKLGFPFNLTYRTWATPTDKTLRLPQDKKPRLPVDKLVPTTFIQATEPKNAKGGDVWIRS